MIFIISVFSWAALSADNVPFLEDQKAFVDSEVSNNECGYFLGRCVFCFSNESSKQNESDCWTCDNESSACCCALASVASMFGYTIFGALACGGLNWSKAVLSAIGIADVISLGCACGCHAPVSMARYLGAEDFLASRERGTHCRPDDPCSCTSLGCGFKGERINVCCDNCSSQCGEACEASCNACIGCCTDVNANCLMPANYGCKVGCRYCWEPCFKTYNK